MSVIAFPRLPRPRPVRSSAAHAALDWIEGHARQLECLRDRIAEEAEDDWLVGELDRQASWLRRVRQGIAG
jgi:hypothetical protein